MATFTFCSDFGSQENKICHCFYIFSICLHEVMWLDAMIFAFWMLSFKPAFLLSSFTLTKKLFRSSLLSAIRVISSTYLRLWYFFWQSWFRLVIHSCHLLLDHVQFTLIHAPNIPDSHSLLFLTASDFTFTTRLSFHYFPYHNWAWFCYTSAFAMTRLWSMKGSLNVITDWIRASQLCL